MVRPVFLAPFADKDSAQLNGVAVRICLWEMYPRCATILSREFEIFSQGPGIVKH